MGVSYWIISVQQLDVSTEWFSMGVGDGIMEKGSLTLNVAGTNQ